MNKYQWITKDEFLTKFPTFTEVDASEITNSIEIIARELDSLCNYKIGALLDKIKEEHIMADNTNCTSTRSFIFALFKGTGPDLRYQSLCWNGEWFINQCTSYYWQKTVIYSYWKNSPSTYDYIMKHPMWHQSKMCVLSVPLNDIMLRHFSSTVYLMYVFIFLFSVMAFNPTHFCY